MNPIARRLVTSQALNVAGVAIGSAAAFVGLAVLIFWVYFTNRGAVYDPLLEEGLDTLQLLFYTALVLHLLGSLGTAAALTAWTKAPIYPTFAVVVVLFALLEVALLLYLSGLHICATGVSFPIPGLPWNCGD